MVPKRRRPGKETNWVSSACYPTSIPPFRSVVWKDFQNLLHPTRRTRKQETRILQLSTPSIPQTQFTLLITLWAVHVFRRPQFSGL